MRTDHTTTTAIETRTERETETETETETEPDRPATVAELTVPAADFALGDTLAALDGVAFELERVVAHSGERALSLVRAKGSARAPLERALADDPSVEGLVLLADVGDEAECEQLYRMEWSERTQGLVHRLTAEEGTILAAVTSNGQWNLRLLLPEREALSRTHDACETAGLTMEITRIYALDEGRQGRFGLTDEQRAALELAFEHGYYEVPRDTRAQEFAEVLGIGHQALSERLRRAHSNLVENTIVNGIDR